MFLYRGVQTTFLGGKFPNLPIFGGLRDLFPWVQNIKLYFLGVKPLQVYFLSLPGFWCYKISRTINSINAFCQCSRENSIIAFVCHNYTCEHPWPTSSYR